MDDDSSSNAPEEQKPQQTEATQETEYTTENQANEPIEKLPEEQHESPKVVPQRGGHKKKRWIWVALALLIIGGAAYWWFAVRSTKSTTNIDAGIVPQSQTKAATKTYTPSNVAYAFKGDTGPYTIYWRLASGGDRTAVNQKLASSENIGANDVNGSNVALATSNAIYISTDSGKTYKVAVKLASNEQVTSLKFAVDGKSIVYGDLPATAGKNTVKSIDLSGSNSKDLFTSDKAGVFIIAYSSDKQKMVYGEGCFDCDGGPTLPVLRDLKTNKNSTLLTGLTTNELTGVVVSADFSTLIYSQATENSSAPDQALGVFTGAPYAINSIDLSSMKTTKVTSFGTKGEKNTNGTLKSREVHIGFVAGTNTLYYSNDTQLYTVKSGTSSLVYEASKPLLYIPFVGTDTVIAGSGTDTADYALVNYNIGSKKATPIFSGDNNTVLFGITTK